MATQIHAFGPNGELSPGAAAALEGLGGGVGGGSTTVQIGTVTLPEDPAEGQSVSVLADSETVLPEGITWDSGGEPVITERMLLVFVWSGTDWVGTYGPPIPAVVIPDPEDETPPTPGTLAASAITSTSFTLTVTGASDETALHSQPYAFSTNNGATWTAWQTSASRNMTELDPETEYTCQHKVRDAAANEATGASITVDTTAASGSTWIDTFADGTGTAEPAGWTKRYTAPTNGTYTEEAGYLDIQRSGTGRSAITLDAANGTGDVDALIKARYVGAPGATFQNYFLGIIVGGSGGVASEDCIVAYARGGTTTPLRAGQYDAGAFTELGTGASGSIGNDAWYWLRVNYASGQFKARFWMDGAAEPSTWHIDVAADVKVGWVGIWDNCSEEWDYEVDYFSASTAGSAPAP